MSTKASRRAASMVAAQRSTISLEEEHEEEVESEEEESGEKTEVESEEEEIETEEQTFEREAEEETEESVEEEEEDSSEKTGEESEEDEDSSETDDDDSEEEEHDGEEDSSDTEKESDEESEDDESDDEKDDSDEGGEEESDDEDPPEEDEEIKPGEKVQLSDKNANATELDIQAEMSFENMDHYLNIHREKEMELERLQESAAGLESLFLATAPCIKEGPLEASVLSSVRISTENLARHAGVSLDVFPETISNESFDLGMENTQVVVDALAWTVKKLWEIVVKIIKDVWTAAKKFWETAFGGAKKLSKKAQKIIKESNKYQGVDLAGAKMDLSKYADKIHIGEEIPRELPTAIADLNMVVRGVFVEHHTAMASYATGVINFLKSLDLTSERNFLSMTESITHIVPPRMNAATIEVKRDKRFHKDMEVYRSKEFLGGKAIFYSKPGEKYKDEVPGVVSDAHYHAQYVLTKTQHSVIEANPRSGGRSKDIRNVLTISEINQICSQVITGSDFFYNYRKNFEERDDLMAEVKDEGEDYKERFTRMVTDDEVTSAIGRAMLQLPTSVAITMDKPATQFGSHAMKVYRALLNMCEDALKYYQ